VPLTRRQILLRAGTSALAGPLRAQQRIGPPVHQRGPSIFLEYDQVELDAAYDQAVYAPNMQQVQARYAVNSDLARTRIGAPTRVSYGPSKVEHLDIYRAKAAHAPIHIFIHGGAWRGGLAKNYAFLAEPFLTAGAHFVIPDFAWVQDAGGSLMTLAAQVRSSIAWVHRNAASFGGDAERVYLSGTSSGAHLAACALTADDIVKGAVLSSGMYDLKAPRLSSRREYVKFDDATEEALSPQRHIEKLHAPLVIAYASLDTPEFQRQSREFATAAKAAGKPVDLIVAEDYNHFELPETMANPHGILGRVALAQMGLGKP